MNVHDNIQAFGKHHTKKGVAQELSQDTVGTGRHTILQLVGQIHYPTVRLSALLATH